MIWLETTREVAARVLIGELEDNITIAHEHIASPREGIDEPAYDRERARLSRIAIRAVRAASKRKAGR